MKGEGMEAFANKIDIIEVEKIYSNEHTLPQP